VETSAMAASPRTGLDGSQTRQAVGTSWPEWTAGPEFGPMPSQQGGSENCWDQTQTGLAEWGGCHPSNFVKSGSMGAAVVANPGIQGGRA
jgi:hypothetical protein